MEHIENAELQFRLQLLQELYKVSVSVNNLSSQVKRIEDDNADSSSNIQDIGKTLLRLEDSIKSINDALESNLEQSISLQKHKIDSEERIETKKIDSESGSTKLKAKMPLYLTVTTAALVFLDHVPAWFQEGWKIIISMYE